MFQDFQEDLDRATSRTRELTLNDNEVKLECTDPYGFWTVRIKGLKSQPLVFQQSFTTYDAAVLEATRWAKKNPGESKTIVKELDFTPYVPPPRLKKSPRPDTKPKAE